MALRYLRFYLGALAALFAFYLGGHYLLGFPFPTPGLLLQLALAVAVGLGLGLLYHRLWPLPAPGWGRVVRLFVLLPPAFVLGMGLTLAFGAQAALHFLIPLLAWLTPAYGPPDGSAPERPSRG
ncbi:MAG: hypothetical protein NZ846_02830 [Thermus sp.]|uniref:hypothetical protein n=1 Tax=unclassified Thermus TaxID=2619321 RepID=UPI00023898AE|nr:MULTISPECIES: hypothetical protein [unclassified Thermus]AEV15881.1 hypothetical protein TCCBUS3UF1_8340 [Thermus sp. CCB_US3_UF1]MCS6869356.1 hypothetical protein [Thermus sp.]MCS7217895.1 hypothetical protein [Thermus sp.]MCX7850132.1 hypothetical protein [Thermus sp.]MDW8016484.1 hypothetical protein [Thermus sp.]